MVGVNPFIGACAGRRFRLGYQNNRTPFVLRVRRRPVMSSGRDSCLVIPGITVSFQASRAHDPELSLRAIILFNLGRYMLAY
jgi:hypothetical protein